MGGKQTKAVQEIVWGNRDNAIFYETLSIEQIKKVAVQAGLSTGCDVDLVLPYLQAGSAVLDVGSGYGRVVEQLREKGFKGSITAVERSKTFAQYLQHNHIEIIDQLVCEDILDFTSKQKFDVILLLWDGIADFIAQEQAQLLAHLARLLTQNGIILFDNLSPLVISENAKKVSSLLTEITLEQAKMKYYHMSEKELAVVTEQLNLQHDLTHYITETGRPRVLHHLSKI